VGERMNMVKVMENERDCNGWWRLLQSIERSNQTTAKTSRSCNFGREVNTKVTSIPNCPTLLSSSYYVYSLSMRRILHLLVRSLPFRSVGCKNPPPPTPCWAPWRLLAPVGLYG
jgi:hypothetical protein